MKKILVFLCPATSELSSSIAGLLSGVERLAGQSGAAVHVAIVGGGGQYAAAAAQYVNGTCYYLDHGALAGYQPDTYLAAIEHVAREDDPDLILAPAGARESEIAPRLAARLQTGLASECVDVASTGDGWRLFRPVYGGKAVAEVRVKTRPPVATLRAGPFTASVATPSVPGEVRRWEADLPPADPRSRSLGRIVEDGEGVRLEEAKVIVSGGRGLGGPTPFAEQLAALAGLLGGAVGASRAAVDAGWVPGSLQVGQTGKTVSPAVYVAVGISGASQHIAGITGAKHVIAINNDADAPIFGFAQLGVVEDWRAMVPALIEALRQRLGR